MKKSRFLLIIIAFSPLSGCVSGLWTGASLFYDRHNVYKSANDMLLSAKIQHAIYYDRRFKIPDGFVNVAVFHGEVLIAGHLPEPAMREEVERRAVAEGGYRSLHVQIAIARFAPDRSNDAWISTKIRSQIVLDDRINPKAFKILTVDGIVYLMGDVKEEQAKLVIEIARNTEGVLRVVNLLKYFTYVRKTR